MKHYSIQLIGGSWLHSSAYDLEDMAEAWKEAGQGKKQAIEKKFACVIIPCDRVLAQKIARDFCENMFNIPTCTYYDGRELSLYCGDAGSGCERLMGTVEKYCLTHRYSYEYIE